MRKSAKRARLFRAGRQAASATAAASAGRGRAVRHRQIAARPRACAAILPEPGAVVLRSDVERKALFGLAETEPPAADRLRARSHGPGLRRTHRQGAAGHRRRPFDDRRRGVRGGRRAGGDRAGGAGQANSTGCFWRRRSRDAACPRRRPHRRCLRCRRGGRAPAGAIRSRRAHLDAHRCVRDARGYVAGGAGAAELKRVQTRFGPLRT